MHREHNSFPISINPLNHQNPPFKCLVRNGAKTQEDENLSPKVIRIDTIIHMNSFVRVS